MLIVRQQFTALPLLILNQNEKINAKICALNSVFLKPIIPQFHCSIIPIGAKPLSSSFCRHDKGVINIQKISGNL